MRCYIQYYFDVRARNFKHSFKNSRAGRVRVNKDSKNFPALGDKYCRPMHSEAAEISFRSFREVGGPSIQLEFNFKEVVKSHHEGRGTGI